MVMNLVKGNLVDFYVKLDAIFIKHDQRFVRDTSVLGHKNYCPKRCDLINVEFLLR
jgi:hypothetical protein